MTEVQTQEIRNELNRLTSEHTIKVTKENRKKIGELKDKLRKLGEDVD